MIELTQTDNRRFVLNCEHIQTIHSIPETKITTFDSHIYLVKEDVDEVVKKVIAYKQQCNSGIMATPHNPQPAP